MPVSFDTTRPPTLPWHKIPPGDATCKVHIIQAGGLSIPQDMALLPGPDTPNNPDDNDKPKKFYAPDYVFLIEHTSTGNQYLFDLGIRKDLENLPPTIVKNVLPSFDCEPKSPADILREHGTRAQQPAHVNAVIFSHMHFDHVGDGAKAGFENAELWVGPTCCTYARPGYPVDEKAPTLCETLPTDGSRKIVESFVPDELLRESGDKRVGQVMEGLRKGLYGAVALKKAGISKDDVDVYEINEAFASQCVWCVRELGLDEKKVRDTESHPTSSFAETSQVNPNGGAIAFGHPLGCTGARQVSTLFSDLGRTGQKVGVTWMCVGTGMGMAAIWVKE